MHCQEMQDASEKTLRFDKIVADDVRKTSKELPATATCNIKKFSMKLYSLSPSPVNTWMFVCGLIFAGCFVHNKQHELFCTTTDSSENYMNNMQDGTSRRGEMIKQAYYVHSYSKCCGKTQCGAK